MSRLYGKPCDRPSTFRMKSVTLTVPIITPIKPSLNKNKTSYKIDKQCLEGRRYSDYLAFIKENRDINIIEMDSVEGIKGGKVLLTIHFVNSSFMLAFLREHNDAQSVIDIFKS